MALQSKAFDAAAKYCQPAQKQGVGFHGLAAEVVAFNLVGFVYMYVYIYTHPCVCIYIHVYIYIYVYQN